MKVLVTVFIALFALFFLSINYVIGVAMLLFAGFSAFTLLSPVKSAIFLGLLFIMFPLVALAGMGFPSTLLNFLIGAFLILVVCRKVARQEAFARTPIDVPLLILAGLGAAGSIAHQIVPGNIAFGGALLFFKGFILFYALAFLKITEDQLRLVMKSFLIVSVFVVFYGILGMVFPNQLVAPIGGKFDRALLNLPAMQSFLGHPGSFSGFIGIIACFTVSKYLLSGKKAYLWATAGLVICMILSFRRTSILGFGLAVFLVLTLSHFRRVITVSRGKVFAFFACVLIVFSGLIFHMFNSLYEDYFSGTPSPRGALWQAGWAVAKDHFPSGSGFGTFGSGINRHHYSPLFYDYHLNNIWGLSKDKPDFTNDTFWPHVAAETGFFGLLTYLFIVYLLIRMTLAGFKSAATPTDRLFAMAMFMVMVLSLVESTKATFYESTTFSYFYFGGMGILWARLRRAEVRQRALVRKSAPVIEEPNACIVSQ